MVIARERIRGCARNLHAENEWTVIKTTPLALSWNRLAPESYLQNDRRSFTFALSSSGGGLPGRPGFGRIRDARLIFGSESRVTTREQPDQCRVGFCETRGSQFDADSSLAASSSKS